MASRNFVTVDIPDGILGPNHRCVAHQHVDIPIADKLREGRVHFALLSDISGGHEYLDVSGLVPDGGFGVEKRLLPTTKESESRRAGFGEVTSGLCTDASTRPC